MKSNIEYYFNPIAYHPFKLEPLYQYWTFEDRFGPKKDWDKYQLGTKKCCFKNCSFKNIYALETILFQILFLKNIKSNLSKKK